MLAPNIRRMCSLKMAFPWARVVVLSVIVALPPTVLSESCPSLTTRANQSLPYPLNVRGDNSMRKSEFLCDFIWTDAQHLKEKLHDRLTQRQKSFVRFTVPVLGYNNPYLSMTNYSGYLTWVWVLDTHEYMLFYPHNFILISTKTMGIVTQDWAIDYNGKAPVSLEGFGVDPDWFDTDDIVGYCDPRCVVANQSCGIGKYELEEFLLNVTEGKDKFKWNWLCLQSPYDVQDIVPVPGFAFPDLLYYWRFLTIFFSRRPWFGFMQHKTDFPQCYCYDREDRCELKELLMHFWVVPIIGLILWLFSPLLIHYFPSSTPKKRRELHIPKDMFPSYKTPIYFGRCLKSMLCFYAQKGMPKTHYLVRIRRLLFLIALAVTGYRLFIYPPYYYYSWPLLACVVVVACIPRYLSEHIKAELPTRFLFWALPTGLIRVSDNLEEYQLLAHVMQERLYLTVDPRFWKFVLERSFHLFHLLLLWRPRNTCLFALGIVVLRPIILLFSGLVFIVAVLVNFLFYFIPLPYFYTALLRAVFVGESQYIRNIWRRSSAYWIMIKGVATCCHTTVMFGLVVYTWIVSCVWCYAISEFTIFTFIGGTLTASIGFKYFVLTGAIVTTVYTLVRDLHEGYDRILEEMIKILKEKGTFTKLAGEVHARSSDKIVLEFRSNEPEYSVTVRKRKQSVPLYNLLIHDGITTYVNKDLYDITVESCRPLRRQILFLVLKIVAMFFYGLLAFWVKNVYHMEDKVGVIFQVVQTVAIYFIPSALQFLSYKSHFGKKVDIILRQDVFDCLVGHLSQIS